MHTGVFDILGAFLWPLILSTGLIVIGAVFAKRAGAGSSRIWAGITVLIALQVLSVLWILITPSLFGNYDVVTYGVVSLVYNIFAGAGLLAAVALIASAATIGRSPIGYPGPGSLGAPPSTYQNPGEQNPGDPSDPGRPSNPYV